MSDDKHEWFAEMLGRCLDGTEWLTPTWHNVLEQFDRYSFDERPSDGVINLLGLMIDEVERLRTEVAETKANYADYVNAENEAINRLQAEMASITEEHARVWEVVREQEKTIERLRGFPLEAVRHLACCNCSCQGNANQVDDHYHHSECMVGRARRFLAETGGEG